VIHIRITMARTLLRHRHRPRLHQIKRSFWIIVSIEVVAVVVVAAAVAAAAAVVVGG